MSNDQTTVPEHVKRHTGIYPISMKTLQDLTLVLPKCNVWPPDDANNSYITDHAGVNVAQIKWNSAEIIFFSDYKHVDKVINRIGRDKVTIIDRPVEYEQFNGE